MKIDFYFGNTEKNWSINTSNVSFFKSLVSFMK